MINRSFNIAFIITKPDSEDRMDSCIISFAPICPTSNIHKWRLM